MIHRKVEIVKHITMSCHWILFINLTSEYSACVASMLQISQ